MILLKKQKRLHFQGPIPCRISSVELKQEPHVLSGTGVLLLIQPLTNGRLIGLSLIASTLVGDHAAGASVVGVSHVLIVMADLPPKPTACSDPWVSLSIAIFFHKSHTNVKIIV